MKGSRSFLKCQIHQLPRLTARSYTVSEGHASNTQNLLFFFYNSDVTYYTKTHYFFPFIQDYFRSVKNPSS